MTAADTWDGSDLFLPEGTGYKFVTEEIKTALEKAKIRNIWFERITEIENEDAKLKYS